MLKGERDSARQAVEEGYLTIAPTVRAFGETRTEADKESNKTSSCRIELMHGLLVGRTPTDFWLSRPSLNLFNFRFRQLVA